MKTSLSIQRLPARRTYAAIHIDESRVSTAIAYVTDMGQIYPMRYETCMLGTAAGKLPELARLEASIRECWTRMQMRGPISYHTCILCPPLTGRAEKSATMTRSVSVTRRRPKFRPGPPKIDGHTMAKLERVLATEALPEGCTVCDLKATSYTLDGERPVNYPVGHSAEVLEVTAHRVFADRDLLTAVIQCLKNLGVEVDILLSGFSAAAGWVEQRDRDLGTTAVNLGLFRSALSFHKGDALQPLATVDCGTDMVLDRVGRILRLGRDEIESTLAANRELLGTFNPTGVEPGEFRNRIELGDESLRAMGSASHQAARELASEFVGQVDRTLGPRHGDTRRIVLVGDELLTMWALCVAGRDIPNTEWIWPDWYQWMLPEWRERIIYDESVRESLNAPILGLLRMFTRDSSPQPNLVEQLASLPALEAGQAAGSRIAMAVESVRNSCSNARARLAQTIAARKAHAQHRSRLISPSGSIPWLDH